MPMETKLIPAWVRIDKRGQRRVLSGKGEGTPAGVVPVGDELGSLEEIFAAGWRLVNVYPLPPDPSKGNGEQERRGASYAVLLHIEREPREPRYEAPAHSTPRQPPSARGMS